MRLPNLKDVFYELFCKQGYAPSEDNRQRFCALIDAAAAKYQIPFKDSEELYSEFMTCTNEEQYFGFVHGFSWAVQLLTGKAPNIDMEDSTD